MDWRTERCQNRWRIKSGHSMFSERIIWEKVNDGEFWYFFSPLTKTHSWFIVSKIHCIKIRCINRRTTFQVNEERRWSWMFSWEWSWTKSHRTYQSFSNWYNFWYFQILRSFWYFWLSFYFSLAFLLLLFFFFIFFFFLSFSHWTRLLSKPVLVGESVQRWRREEKQSVIWGGGKKKPRVKLKEEKEESESEVEGRREWS